MWLHQCLLSYNQECQAKNALECCQWRPYKVRQLVSESIYAKKDHPSANQGLCTDNCRHTHLLKPFGWIHLLTYPCPTLSAHEEAISQGLTWSEAVDSHLQVGKLVWDVTALVHSTQGQNKLLSIETSNFIHCWSSCTHHRLISVSEITRLDYWEGLTQLHKMSFQVYDRS